MTVHSSFSCSKIFELTQVNEAKGWAKHWKYSTFGIEPQKTIRKSVVLVKQFKEVSKSLEPRHDIEKLDEITTNISELYLMLTELRRFEKQNLPSEPSISLALNDYVLESLTEILGPKLDQEYKFIRHGHHSYLWISNIVNSSAELFLVTAQ